MYSLDGAPLLCTPYNACLENVYPGKEGDGGLTGGGAERGKRVCLQLGVLTPDTPKPPRRVFLLSPLFPLRSSTLHS